jgi:hypothetical protein
MKATQNKHDAKPENENFHTFSTENSTDKGSGISTFPHTPYRVWKWKIPGME